MRIATGVLAILTWGSQSQAAPSIPKHCQGTDVKSFAARVVPTSADQTTFTYSYRKLRDARAGSPTIVFLPGGPGDDSMAATSRNHPNDLALIPANFGLILTDPRGVGCNYSPQIPETTFTNETLAHDVLGIVKNERLQHYYLHGLSAGTALAVVTAALAEKTGVTPPSAVILEGVIGRAFKPGEQYVGFQKQWRRVYAQLKPGLRSDLRKASPLGLDASTWGMALPGSLIDDRDDQGSRATARFLESAAGDLDKFKSTIETLAEGAREAVPPEVATHYRNIACHEFVDEAFSMNSDEAFSLVRGQLTPVKGPACDGLKLDRPFDSANYRIRAPLFYVQGKLDPSTTVEQARYSFAKQTRSRRTFITVTEGGHHAFWALKDCEPTVWAQIERGGRDLEAALKTCRVKTSVNRAEAN